MDNHFLESIAVRRIVQIIAIVIVFALLAPGFGGSKPTPSGTIKGTVRNLETGKILEGALVEVQYPQTGITLFSSYTDDKGKYTLRKVTEGTWDMRVTAEGYIPEFRTGVVVVAGTTTTENFLLEAGNYGSVDGVAIDEDTQQCVNDASVFLEGSMYSYSAKTAIDGVFNVVDVRPGTYTLRIVRSDYSEYVHQLPISVDDGQNVHIGDIFMSQIPLMIPIAPLGSSSVAVGDEVFIFGGNNYYLVRDVICYNLTTHVDMVFRDALPSGRWYTSAIWTGNYAYVFGGRISASLPVVSTSEILKFDPVTNTASVCAYLPKPLHGTSAIWTGTYAYIFGGTEDGTTSEGRIYRFDPLTNTVTTMQAVMSSLCFTSAVYDGQTAYIFGGSSSFGYYADTIIAYYPDQDVVDNSLSVSLPLKLSYTTALWTGDKALIFGGRGQGVGLVDPVIEFDSVLLSAGRLLRDLPEPTADCCAVCVGSACYLIGGYRRGDVYEYRSSSITPYYDYSQRDNYGVDSQHLYVGGIVDVANGNVVLSVTDLSLQGKGFAISFTRTYNSLTHLDVESFGPYGGVLGWGWTHNYDVSLKELGFGEVVLKEACGSTHVFYRDPATEEYIPPPGTSYRLTKDQESGNFTLWTLDGARTQFNSSGKLASVINKNGDILHMLYDSRGRLIQVRDDVFNFLNFTYPLASSVTLIDTVYDSTGRTVDYTYNGDRALVHVLRCGLVQETYYQYYMNGSISPESLQLKNIHQKIESRYIPSLGFTTNLYDTTEFVYEEGDHGRVEAVWKSETRRSGDWIPLYPPVQKYSLDYVNSTHIECTCSLGGILKVDLNTEGFPVYIEGPPMVSSPTCGSGCSGGGVSYPGKTGNENLTLVWNDEYRVIMMTDANGHSHTYDYDVYGNLVNVTNPLGYSVKSSYEVIETPDRYISLLMNSTDALGHMTEFIYDSRGNLNKTIDALGNFTESYYDESGYLTWTADKLGNTVSYEYDALGAIDNITDPLGGITEFDMDTIGYYYNMTDALNRTWSTQRDGTFYELEKSFDPTGNYSLKEFNWRQDVIEYTDFSGNSTQYVYNITLGKLDSLTNALGDETRHLYNSMGFLTSVIDANGHYTNYSYDSYARVKSVTLPMGQIYEYTYDHAGNIIDVEYPNGSSVSYTYDALNRLRTTEYPDDTVITLTYDANGNLLNISGQDSWKNYTYDDLSRPVVIRTYLGLIDYLVAEEIEYDANGKVVENRIYAGSYCLINSYDYDALSRVHIMSTETTDGDSMSWEFFYDAASQCIGVNATYGPYNPYYNTTYSYDTRGNLLAISVMTDGSYAPPSHKYIYDSMSRLVVAWDPEAGGAVSAYKYDEIGQLVSYYFLESLPDYILENYTYDGVGNRLSVEQKGMPDIFYSYDANDRLTSSSEGVTYDYDENGNCIREYYYDEGELYDKTYTYGYNNRLIRVNSSSGILATYSYTADGQLAISASAWPSMLVTYVHLYLHGQDLAQEVIRIGGGDYNIMWWGPGVDQILAVRLGQTGPLHAFVDGFGNTRHLVSADDGSLFATQSYTPFGEMTEGTWFGIPSFQGRFYDPATGLYDFRDRYYSAGIGRYTARPSDPRDGESDYLFPGNDPVNNRDPTGHPIYPGALGELTKYLWSDIYWDGSLDPVWMTHEEIGEWLYYVWSYYWIEEVQWDCVGWWVANAIVDGNVNFWSHDSCVLCVGSLIIVGLIEAGTYIKNPYLLAMGLLLEAIFGTYHCVTCIWWLMEQPWSPPSCDPIIYVKNPWL